MSEKDSQKKSPALKIILVAVVVGLISCFFYFDLGQYLTLSYLKAQRAGFQTYFQENPFLTSAIFMGLYITATALSLPGAALLTLAAGGLFGLLWGTIMVSFASTIGATLSFLTARFLLRDWVQEKFGEKLKAINRGVEEEGAFYLLTLRLVPAFPFFMINLLMGLTPIRTVVYFFVSQVGMFPGTVVYVNAGTQLGELESVSGILSPGLIFSFALLGIFPQVAKKLMNALKSKKSAS